MAQQEHCQAPQTGMSATAFLRNEGARAVMRNGKGAARLVLHNVAEAVEEPEGLNLHMGS
jgi:hypothetical protein